MRGTSYIVMYTMPQLPVVRALVCTVALVEPIISIVCIQMWMGDPFVWARQDISGDEFLGMGGLLHTDPKCRKGLLIFLKEITDGTLPLMLCYAKD